MSSLFIFISYPRACIFFPARSAIIRNLLLFPKCMVSTGPATGHSLRTRGEKKSPLQIITVRDELSRGSTLFELTLHSLYIHQRLLMSEPLNYDDNGITGLFCSHSEVVFRRFQNKKLSARGFSLWHFFPSLLFSSTCFLIHFHYNTAFCFVNIFSATVSRPQNIPAQNNLEIIMGDSLPVSEMAP